MPNSDSCPTKPTPSLLSERAKSINSSLDVLPHVPYTFWKGGTMSCLVDTNLYREKPFCSLCSGTVCATNRRHHHPLGIRDPRDHQQGPRNHCQNDSQEYDSQCMVSVHLLESDADRTRYRKVRFNANHLLTPPVNLTKFLQTRARRPTVNDT